MSDFIKLPYSLRSQRDKDRFRLENTISQCSYLLFLFLFFGFLVKNLKHFSGILNNVELTCHQVHVSDGSLLWLVANLEIKHGQIRTKLLQKESNVVQNKNVPP